MNKLFFHLVREIAVNIAVQHPFLVSIPRRKVRDWFKIPKCRFEIDSRDFDECDLDFFDLLCEVESSINTAFLQFLDGHYGRENVFEITVEELEYHLSDSELYNAF